MSAYQKIFKLSISRLLTYRLDFLMGRVRNIIVMLVLFYVWTYLTKGSTAFAGYSRQELITYVFGMNVLKAVVFGEQSRKIAQDINDGTFSSYLLKPISVWKLFYFRELGERVTLLFTSVLEVALFLLVLHETILFPASVWTLVFFLVALFLGHILYFLLSLLLNFLAFWTREAMGPRFLFEWLLEFGSGVYFPISIVTHSFGVILSALPYLYILFVPMQIYLGKLSLGGVSHSLLLQILWIGLIGILTFFTWKKGLQKYTGDGI